jgi:hypothetical protein
VTVFAGYEPLGEALACVRRTFEAARSGADNAFSLLEADFCVDQVRGVVVTAGRPEDWTERDGRRLLRNDDRVTRSFMGLYLGSSAYLSARQFAGLVADLCRGHQRQLSPEPNIAAFVNVTVVQARHDPGHELPVWVTVASRLASGRENENILAAIPELVVAHDPLFAEIPADASAAEHLRPRPSETMARYEARLLSDVLGQDVSGLGTDAERKAAFTARTDEFEAYVRTHLLDVALAEV